ncbi:MAG TPA: hypothetical protein VF516_34890 [Kofleriaceae bacterium]
MKTFTKMLALLVTTPLFAPGLAGADVADPSVATVEVPAPYSYAWHDSRLQSGIGISAMLGVGVGGFTNQTMRDTVSLSVASLWDLRVTIGSHTPLALDLSYVGTASGIDALIGFQHGTLIGTTAEGALRYNILPHNAWNPYTFAGIGWQRYDLTGGSFALSDTGMNDSDNSIVFPMGAGLAYRDRSGIVADVHGTFRANTRAGLVLDGPGSTSYAPMHTWAASAAFGFEY